MSNIRRRKKITDKIRLIVFKRDNHSCKICGANSATQPGLDIEVDHIIPFSCGGSDELENYQTLCRRCNGGKGNNESLNRTIKNEIDMLINHINPEILNVLKIQGIARVVANQEDYRSLCTKISYGEFYHIEYIPNTIIGFQSGKSLGIYTIHDNGGSKANFFIKNI